jgi:hypothetical protein
MKAPLTMMQAGDGNFYGSTNTNATFRYDTSTQQLSQVYQL